MHSFFAFCAANDMLRKNPMSALKKPKTPDVVPTDYFLPKEFEQIVAATDKYEYVGGNDNQNGSDYAALTQWIELKKQ
jgi:site-specific recombinase XerD